MTKVKELLTNDDIVLVFDMDGVLSKLEFGEYTHYDMDDEAWAKACLEGANFYDEDKVSKKMQKYISKKNIDNIYVISKSYTENECQCKIDFLTKNYQIKRENIFFVKEDKQKVEHLFKIKEKYPNLEDYKIAMIDDTTDVLNNIMANSKFSTIHISSFLDL